jgi:hypothetical protein
MDSANVGSAADVEPTMVDFVAEMMMVCSAVAVNASHI